ncbi:unnamed protein product, partial [Closterium sp. NIES-54]
VAEVDLSAIKAAITPACTSAPVFALDALRALDVKLRDYAAQRFLLVKDKFFDKSFGRVAPLPGGIEAWTGFNVSFRPIHNALALNLGACCAVLCGIEACVDGFQRELQAHPQRAGAQPGCVLLACRSAL